MRPLPYFGQIKEKWPAISNDEGRRGDANHLENSEGASEAGVEIERFEAKPRQWKPAVVHRAV